MPDEIFANPRLAPLYDVVDGDRGDLVHYLALTGEFAAASVLDIGCGTGELARQLVAKGIRVVGLDPAAASLAVAKGKPGADQVEWILGDATAIPGSLVVDLVVMTGNVAQVFLDDQDWLRTLGAARAALSDGGHLVFEIRNPARRAWVDWNPDASFRRIEVPGPDGPVQLATWVEVVEVALPFVSFRRHYQFDDDEPPLVSDSTLRFRRRDEVEADLNSVGFRVDAVRDAPDRPGRELVFVATAAGSVSNANAWLPADHDS